MYMVMNPVYAKELAKSQPRDVAGIFDKCDGHLTDDGKHNARQWVGPYDVPKHIKETYDIERVMFALQSNKRQDSNKYHLEMSPRPSTRLHQGMFAALDISVMVPHDDRLFKTNQLTSNMREGLREITLNDRHVNDMLNLFWHDITNNTVEGNQIIDINAAMKSFEDAIREQNNLTEFNNPTLSVAERRAIAMRIENQRIATHKKVVMDGRMKSTMAPKGYNQYNKDRY